MPDISMCLNKTCVKRTSCFRYMAIPGSLQSYTPFKITDGQCDYFWPMTPEQQKQLQKLRLAEIMKADEQDGLYEDKSNDDD